MRLKKVIMGDRMNQDLKIIKKKYGEEMMHLCRELFPTLLEQEGLLPNLLFHSFHESHSIARDILENNLEFDFKNYIYSLVDVENNYRTQIDKTPEELLRKVGYQLYECHTEEDIQVFKKYYASGEELCTFQGGRLNRCHVFFAVKDNVDKIKREDFLSPQRQDEYGTSVISIQFTKDSLHTLSIKNRYNHRVNNPDSTYGNNLDNIIFGLTDSFERYYGMRQVHKNENFELPGYIRAGDGKLYKYNYEINNIYYCEDNVIIDNFEVKKYPKERYLLFDYFLLDLQEKKIKLYDEKIEDSLPDTIGDIEKISIDKESDKKNIIIQEKKKSEAICFSLDSNNRFTSLKNNNLEWVPKNFLYYNETLKELEMLNALMIENNFLYHNYYLEKIKLPKVAMIDNNFLYYNMNLKQLYLPSVVTVGDRFLFSNNDLLKVELPKVITIGNAFLNHNYLLNYIYLPKVMTIGDDFLSFNQDLKYLSLPSVTTIGKKFLSFNHDLEKIDLPSVTMIGDNCLSSNYNLVYINLPEVVTIGDGFLNQNQLLKKVELPKVVTIGKSFLNRNSYLRRIMLPNATVVGDGFLSSNEELEEVYFPKVVSIGDRFLSSNQNLKSIYLPNALFVGKQFLFYATDLERAYLPKAIVVGDDFLFFNKKLKSTALPEATTIGKGFLSSNQILESIYLPKAVTVGNGFLFTNLMLQKIDLPNAITIGNNFLSFNSCLNYIEIPKVKKVGRRFLESNTNFNQVVLQGSSGEDVQNKEFVKIKY